jgi:phosphoenolpyruvate carboxylase
MAKQSVASALIAQVDFNMSMMRALLKLIEVIPGADENKSVIEAIRELSNKNSDVLEHVKIAIAESNPGVNDGS